MKNVEDQLALIIRLIDIQKEESLKCSDCSRCKIEKALLEKIVLLSAEVVAYQAEKILKMRKEEFTNVQDEIENLDYKKKLN